MVTNALAYFTGDSLSKKKKFFLNHRHLTQTLLNLDTVVDQLLLVEQNHFSVSQRRFRRRQLERRRRADTGRRFLPASPAAAVGVYRRRRFGATFDESRRPPRLDPML